MTKALNLPINSVSFGQVSLAYLRYLFERKDNPYLFPIGSQIDFSTQKNIPDGFKEWIQASITKAYEDYSKKDAIFKLWHLNGSLESFGKDQVLLSFYELDTPTKVELNVARNCKALLFTSKFSVENFKKFGLENVFYVPLFFDRYNFNTINKDYFNDGRIVFNLVGKLERRKHHLKIIKAWAKKFGNNSKYFLQCSIFNPFLKPEDQTKVIASALDGKVYFNINFLNFMPNNMMYNDYLNSGDIVIGMSGGEGWGLPEFHSIAMGKYGIIMNEHGYKSWANENNAILINPNSKIEAYDGIFFNRNSPYNQGNIFDFNEDEFIFGCETAIEKVKKNKINTEGLKLQSEYTIEKFAENIDKYM